MPPYDWRGRERWCHPSKEKKTQGAANASEKRTRAAKERSEGSFVSTAAAARVVRRQIGPTTEFM